MSMRMMWFAVVPLAVLVGVEPVASVGAMSAPLSFVALTTGNGNSCGIATDGTAYCWGWDENGKLGDGVSGQEESCPNLSLICVTTPSALALAASFQAISAGHAHTCGITTVGHGACWGINVSGELGTNSFTLVESNQPLRVRTLGHAFALIGAGAGHSCATADPSGLAFCWGSNSVGQLGTGSTTGPQTCRNEFGTYGCSSRPVTVMGSRRYASLSVGNAHTCALDAGGVAYCWGSGLRGQLGNGGVDSAEPVPVEGGLSFVAISAGLFHTCGIATSGTAYCWGENDFGQLGTGTVPSSDTPVPVPDLSFVAIDAGYYHTCGISTSGPTYCWGRNFNGNLGNGGSELVNLSATEVLGDLTFSAISAGGLHTCALTPAGTAYCWGANYLGSLGIGTTSGPDSCPDFFPACSKQPVAVVGPAGAASRAP